MSRDDAWVLTVGDELLRGEIVDSNKSFLSERLLRLDLETARHTSVPDDAGAIAEQLRAAAERARFVLVSGGLGPTRDDITTEVVAKTFGRKLVRDAAALEQIERYFRATGRTMSENNAKQADFPDGAEVLPNPVGTAPGFALDTSLATGAAGGALLFCMPGVPGELYRMMDSEVLPRIERELRRASSPGALTRIVRARLIRTFGLGESVLDRELSDLARDDPDLVIGFRTQFPDNLVRVVARAATAEGAEARLAETTEEIERRLGPIVLGLDETPLEVIVGRLLIERGVRIALAESCTGGLVAGRLTDLPGSSAYLLEAIVAYSNEAKIRTLGVRSETLERHGAVSEEVAVEMARGAREHAGADLAVSTTGVAGPSGGSEEKPVGTLFVGLADESGARARRYALLRDRARNKSLAAHVALEWLRRWLLGLELPDETFPRLRGRRG